MFGAIGATIGKILGTDQAARALVDNTANMFDKLVYTKEEQAEDDARDKAAARAMVIDWMKATSGQNLARRLLALLITGVWLLQYVTLVIMSCVAPFVTDSTKLEETIRILGGFTQQMNGAVMLILAFYFAAPHMGSIVQGALQKFGK